MVVSAEIGHSYSISALVDYPANVGSLTVRAAVPVAAPMATVWSIAVNWEAHSRWVPLTTVTVVQDCGGLGTRFVGRTGVGPLAFDDPMTVTVWQPPHLGSAVSTCTVTKTGRVVTGTAGFTVTETSSTTCQLEWFEDIDIRPIALVRLMAPVLRPLARAGLRQTLHKLAQDAEAIAG